VWLCGDQEYPSLDSYNSSSCAQTSNNADGLGDRINIIKVPDRCKYFKPDKRCGGFLKNTSPKCTCK